MAQDHKLMNLRKKIAAACVLGALVCGPLLTACSRSSVAMQAPIVSLSIIQDR